MMTSIASFPNKEYDSLHRLIAKKRMGDPAPMTVPVYQNLISDYKGTSAHAVSHSYDLESKEHKIYRYDNAGNKDRNRRSFRIECGPGSS